MNLKEQKNVCMLAKCKTISRAAQELHISTPALSVFLSNLEKQMGVPLFCRTGKVLEPTEIGLEYIKRAEIMLRLKEEFDGLVELKTKNHKKILRVGIQQRRAVFLAPLLLPMFLQEHPDVDLIIKEGDYDSLIKMFAQQQIDVLLNVYEELPDAEVRELMEEPILIAIPDEHPIWNSLKKKGESSIAVSDVSLLNGQTLILPAKSQSLRLSVEKIFKEYGVKPGHTIEISNFATAMAMVDKGMGIGFNRQGYLKTMRELTHAQYYTMGNPPLSSKMMIAYHRDKPLHPYMEDFFELAKDCLEKS